LTKEQEKEFNKLVKKIDKKIKAKKTTKKPKKSDSDEDCPDIYKRQIKDTMGLLIYLMDPDNYKYYTGSKSKDIKGALDNLKAILTKTVSKGWPQCLETPEFNQGHELLTNIINNPPKLWNRLKIDYSKYQTGGKLKKYEKPDYLADVRPLTGIPKVGKLVEPVLDIGEGFRDLFTDQKPMYRMPDKEAKEYADLMFGRKKMSKKERGKKLKTLFTKLKFMKDDPSHTYT
jgi:hypothetical protein